MRFSVWPGPANDWEPVLALASRVEELGYHGLWLADHFMPNSADAEGPVHEAWTLLAALAARVPRLRLGTLVSGNTYRHPALLAKMATGVDRISGGRVVLGLGAGWQENEHRAYGIGFPAIGERLARLDEACAVIRGLLEQDRTTFEGEHYRLANAPLQPKPIQSRVPLLIGGGGERVTLRIAARHADEWNVWGTPDVLRRKGAILDGHAESLSRDPTEIGHCAVALLQLVDDSDRGGVFDGPPPRWVGTPEQLVEIVADYHAAGVREIVVPDFTLGHGARRDETLERFAREVMDRVPA